MDLNPLLYLIIMVFIGFVAYKLRLLPESTSEAIPALLMNITYPAMIITTFQNLDLDFIISSGIIVVVSTAVFTVSLFVLGRVIFKSQEPTRRALLNFNLGLGNVTYVGIPMLSIFFGPAAVSIAVFHGAIQDIFIWLLYYPTFITNKGKQKLNFFKNPCIIAMIIGITLAITKIRLPSFISITLDNLSFITSPIALLFLGIMMAQYGLSGWIKNPTAIKMSIAKVIVLPLVLFFILNIFVDLYHAIIISLLFGCPTTVMSIVWSKQYDNDVKLAVETCVCSTLMHMVFVGMFLSVIKYLGII